MNVLLKPALRRLWRDPATLQLGLDPRRAVVLSGLDPAVGGLLDLLDGTRDRDGVLAAAVHRGVDRARTATLLELLDAAGALDDPAAGPGALADHPLATRDRLAPDVAGQTLRLRGAHRVFAARQRALVRVVGSGRVGAPLAAMLGAAGVGAVAVDDPERTRPADLAPGGLEPGDLGAPRGAAMTARLARDTAMALGVLEPLRAGDPAGLRVGDPAGLRPADPAGLRPADLTVLAPVGPLAAGAAEDLVARGLAHLLVAVRENTAVIGPFVLPGRTACLRCLDLLRTDRDPAWPRLAAQLAGAAAPGEPCDVLLASMAAAFAALDAVAFLAGEMPVTAGGTLEFDLDDHRLRRRSWAAHPGCECGAAMAVV